MAKRRVKFTYPTELIKEPLIYYLGKDFNIVTNIRRAEVNSSKGWVVLELEGDEGDIERGIAWVMEKGVRVDPISGDIVEG